MKIKKFILQRFERWLSQRIPAQKHHTLTSKNIFILPTRFGFTYLLFVLLLFLLGTNYQNNLIILFSFVLASFFITVMLHSFFNFSKISIHSEPLVTGYCDKNINIPFSITAHKEHFDIQLDFKDQQCNSLLKVTPVTLLQVNNGNNTVNLSVQAPKRGKYLLGRLTVKSEYSFGLFKSWSKLDFEHMLIVYPSQRVLNAIDSYLCSTNDETHLSGVSQSNQLGIDEFSELKNFVRGESLARTAWKQLAKGQGHYTKHYQSQQGEPVWLTFDGLPNNQLEIKLQYLSYLVTTLSLTNQEFGLLLKLHGKKTIKIPPSSGLEHKANCLHALATY